ncbi:MAG TPA: methyltransferase domain-containing protein [Segetibacter sp.]
MDKEAIKKYYTETQFEYGLMWNWMLKTTPALHFGYYDEKATSHKQAILRANEVLAEFGEIIQGSEIIDAGCGLGHSSEWLAQHFNAKVTGITIVPKQVETIKKRLIKYPVANVDFIVGDYLYMPFQDSSVDIVWAIESVCHAPDKLLFFKEAFRVLKPGGKVIMADIFRMGRPMSDSKETLLKEVFGGWAIPDIDTVEEHNDHATKAGFTSFKSKDVTDRMMVSYRNLREISKRYYSIGKFLHKAKIISALRHNNMLSCLKQADAVEQGVFSYQHIVAQK